VSGAGDFWKLGGLCSAVDKRHRECFWGTLQQNTSEALLG
jgi:hypothetical protein